MTYPCRNTYANNVYTVLVEMGRVNSWPCEHAFKHASKPLLVRCPLLCADGILAGCHSQLQSLTLSMQDVSMPIAPNDCQGIMP